VLINVLLGKQAGAVWSKSVGVNSRRADVPVFDPDLVAQPALQLVKVNGEETIDELQKTQQLAKQALD
jgi:hypothetical protein